MRWTVAVGFGQPNTPARPLRSRSRTHSLAVNETITVDIGGRDVTVIGPDEATVAADTAEN
ncbi:hypothetical protein C9J85_04950 [Haloferax sp. wsp5]|nr:hypothetical protein C9J85_04950 [Haloferax sp. wsp5]